MGARDHIVPGSDGAGVVEATGSRVTRFKPGDKVVTLFNQDHLAGPITIGIRNTGLGGLLDGTLRKYGTFHEQGLVAMPVTLDFQQASTLSCAAVTAWNAFYGLESRALKPGDIVLTQGTGGVSIFALQVRTLPPFSPSLLPKYSCSPTNHFILTVRQSGRCPRHCHNQHFR